MALHRVLFYEPPHARDFDKPDARLAPRPPDARRPDMPALDPFVVGWPRLLKKRVSPSRRQAHPFGCCDLLLVAVHVAPRYSCHSCPYTLTDKRHGPSETTRFHWVFVAYRGYDTGYDVALLTGCGHKKTRQNV